MSSTRIVNVSFDPEAIRNLLGRQFTKEEGVIVGMAMTSIKSLRHAIETTGTSLLKNMAKENEDLKKDLTDMRRERGEVNRAKNLISELERTIKNLQTREQIRERKQMEKEDTQISIQNDKGMSDRGNIIKEIDKITDRSKAYVMYLIVRESLKMGAGKTAAQVGHAVMQLMLKYDVFSDFPVFSSREEAPFDHYCADNIGEFNEWLKEPTKVVLRANEQQWQDIKKNTYHTIVVDAGYTEVPPDSETVIGLWPIRKCDAPAIIKSLPIL